MSPTVFKDGPYRFFFFSREEPRRHVHVIGAGGEAKFWLEPEVKLATSSKLTTTELNSLKKLIINREKEILDAWNSHFEC